MKYDVFLSYSHPDKVWVRQLAEALSKKGLRVFLDQVSVKPAKSIGRQLERGLLESEYIVPIISTETLSPNQAFEFGAALGSESPLIAVVDQSLPSKAIPGPIKRTRYFTKSTPTTKPPT